MIFVVQKHYSKKLHYDFRLEMDGALKSWAVPKGVPVKEGVRHLAVQVEDHKLSYAGFEGEIPEGQYGAGKVEIWDSGSYELESKKPEKIVFVLHGKKLRGRYTILKFKKAGDSDWLIFKAREK